MGPAAHQQPQDRTQTLRGQIEMATKIVRTSSVIKLTGDYQTDLSEVWEADKTRPSIYTTDKPTPFWDFGHHRSTKK